MKSNYLYKYIIKSYFSKNFRITKLINTSQKNQHTLITNKYRNFVMANSVPKFEILPHPIKSESDKKEYRVIKLENELVACLISDSGGMSDSLASPVSDTDSEMSLTYSDSSESESESEAQEIYAIGGKTSHTDERMAAAALCIGVGSFSDPPEVPGMAHFLEHMVFMGSEKYPTENDFDSFIKKGGGSNNASTDTERTSFYFECLEAHLPEALDKFSQFFIAPLMKKGAMTREREAIDSEFQMALPSDSSRKEQLLCSLANPNTPVNSFSWGNLKTLKDNISDEKLYEGVHQFRKKHYSAHRMTLAVQARLPLDTLQDLVVNCFYNIPNNKLRKDDFSKFAEGVFSTPPFHRMYYIKPLKELIKLDLNWSLPCMQDKYRSKPIQYVSYLLGDEGKGSLLSYLKKRMWAISAQAGNEETGTEHNSMYAMFNVSFSLTEEGLKHVSEILDAVFSYINLVKQVGPQRRIYDEIKLISDIAFRFSTEESPIDNVEDLCESMQLYPSEDFMAGSEIYYEYDPKTITFVLEHLVPRKLNVMVTTKNLPDGLKFDKVEKWFGVQYTDIDISADMIDKWTTIEPYPELSIPCLNPYLTDNFAILHETPKHPDYPQKIIDTPYCELWYRKDQKFKLPMALYYFYIVIPGCTLSVKHFVLSDMFMNLLSFSIAEEAYPATVANLAHSFTTIERGMVFKIWGFNDKIPALIELVAKYIKNLNDFVNEEMFLGVKESMQKYYYNRLLKPTGLAKDLRLKVLIQNYWTPLERYNELLTLTYEDVIKYMEDYTKCLFLKSLVQGNVLPEVVTATVEKFVNTLKYEPLPKDQYPYFVITQLPLGEKCLISESFNKNDTNSITANYYQIGVFTLKDNALTDLIMLIIEEPLFDILRTKEQLGYHVYCTARDTYGILGYSIVVNSQVDKFSTQHLDSRIKEFIKYTQKILKDMSVADFERIKEDLIKTKEISDVHLREEVDRNWSEIVNDEYMFDRLKQDVETIRTVTLDELKTWWNKLNHYGTKENYRKISIQVVGHSLDKDKVGVSRVVDNVIGKPLVLKLLGEKKKEGENVNYFIDNVDNFRAKLQLYPLRQIK